MRIPHNEPWLAKTLMDVGAAGICIPMVNTEEQARRASGALRYPPAGTRSWGPFYAPLRWGLAPADYARAADAAMLCVAFVEHVEALDQLDAILAVDGVDVVLVGPGDLATSMGLAGDMQHPRVGAAIRGIEQRVLAAGKVLGGFSDSSEGAAQLVDRGYRFIICGLDASLLARAAAAAAASVRQQLARAAAGSAPAS